MSDVEEFYGTALWYAFGRLDAPNGGGIGPHLRAKLDAFEFARFVKERRQEFVDEKVMMFKSIQELWQEYIDSK